MKSTFPENIHTAFSNALRGLLFTSIEHPSDWYWKIVLGKGEVVFGVESPWRLLVNGSIAFGDKDHAQKFGLPEPVDGLELCRMVLQDAAVLSAAIQEGTADVVIKFDNGAQLEIFNHSSGYEGWSCTFAKLNIIGMGGGELAIMARS
jgi:hypothetical protein